MKSSDLKKMMRDEKIKTYLSLNKENYLRPNNCLIFEKLLVDWILYQSNAFDKLEKNVGSVDEISFNYFYQLDAWINNYQTPNLNCFHEIRTTYEVKYNLVLMSFENIDWMIMENQNNIMQTQIINIINEFLYDMELIYSIYDEKQNSKKKISEHLSEIKRDDLSKIWNVLCRIRNIIEHPKSNQIQISSKHKLKEIVNLIYKSENENWDSLSKIKFNKNNIIWKEIYSIHKNIMCEIATEINKLVFEK